MINRFSNSRLFDEYRLKKYYNEQTLSGVKLSSIWMRTGLRLYRFLNTIRFKIQ